MFKAEGFYETDFMSALRAWDMCNTKRVRCVYREELTEYSLASTWRKDFKVDGGMILDGKWFVER